MAAQGTPKKRRRWIWWAVLAVVVVVVGVVVASGMFGGSSQQTTYTTSKVAKTTLAVTVSGSGNGAVASATQVQPSITGTVKNLKVKLGDTVTKGEVLFTIVNDQLDTAVARAKTSYLQAKASLVQAKQSLADARSALYAAQHPASGTVDSAAVASAKTKVSTAQTGVTVASNNVSSASKDITSAQDNANARTVRAPVSGVITVLNAKNGQSLNGSSSSGSSYSAASGSASNSAVEISDLSTLQASVSINEIDLVNVKVGMAAAVTFDALPNVATSGTISSIAPTGNSSNSGVVTYDVIIALSNADARLRPGMSCTAEITVDTRSNVLAVPSSAIRSDSSTGKKYVLVGDTSTGAVTQVTVETGVVVGTQTEITSGLTEGQTVLIGSDSSSSSSSSGNTRGGGGIGGFGAFVGRG